MQQLARCAWVWKYTEFGVLCNFFFCSFFTRLRLPLCWMLNCSSWMALRKIFPFSVCFNLHLLAHGYRKSRTGTFVLLLHSCSNLVSNRSFTGFWSTSLMCFVSKLFLRTSCSCFKIKAFRQLHSFCRNPFLVPWLFVCLYVYFSISEIIWDQNALMIADPSLETLQPVV